MSPMRLAWFSPVPPVRSGIATCSAELVSALRAGHDIDIFVDEPIVSAERQGTIGARSAHEFIWRHRRQPYDLSVYQLGNSSHHDYLWPYLFRFPGLAVLHDAHLHHARAASLLRTKRADDYRAEFAANHPDASPDLAELAVAGLDSHLYYYWPMTRLVALASRLTATQAPALTAELGEAVPTARVETLHLAHGRLVSDEEARQARVRLSEVHGLPPDATIVGVYGGLTPDKRLPQILEAFRWVRAYTPSAHLLLVGASPSHYDVAADVRARDLAAHVTLTGYVESDDELTEAIAACDVSVNLRWPTAREMSGPWLRALAAGKATITADLAHLVHVPSLDPRTWKLAARTSPLAPRTPPLRDANTEKQEAEREKRDARSDRRDARRETRDASSEMREARGEEREAVTVAIDVLDEDHSLRLALRRLLADGDLRAKLGGAARSYWAREHSMTRMVADYERVLALAVKVPIPRPTLPAHLVNSGEGLLRTLRTEMRIAAEPDALW